MNLHKIFGEDVTTEDYRDGIEFKELCVRVVACVKSSGSATFGHLRRTLYGSDWRANQGKTDWLFEAVESCKRAGLISEQGSAQITVFVPGGHEIRPEKKKYEPSMIFNAPKGVKKSPYADLGVVKR